MRIDLSAQAFWQYSLQFYGATDNKEALLSLQDDCGLNVNLVLAVLFLSHYHIALDLEAIEKMYSSIVGLDKLTMQQREKRRALVSDAQLLKKSLLAGQSKQLAVDNLIAGDPAGEIAGQSNQLAVDNIKQSEIYKRALKEELALEKEQQQALAISFPLFVKNRSKVDVGALKSVLMTLVNVFVDKNLDCPEKSPEKSTNSTRVAHRNIMVLLKNFRLSDG